MAQKLISRADAEAKGLKRFYTGKPCSRGHIAERFVTDGSCCACKLENTAAFRKEHNVTGSGKAKKVKTGTTSGAAKSKTVGAMLREANNLVTAAIIEREPKPRSGTYGTRIAHLHRLGREIRARVESLDRIGAKAVDMVDSINYLLGEAEQLCTPDGFVAFKQTYCPELGRSRTYELLAIEQGRKTVEQIRAAGRERVAKHRAAQRSVTDNKSVTADAKPEPPVIEAEVILPSGVDNLRLAVERAHLAESYPPDVLAAAILAVTGLPKHNPPTIEQLESAATFLMKVAEAMRRKPAA